MADDPHDETSTESDEAIDPTAPGFDRREALKKAAVGGAVVAGVWMAPKIQGLSLEPDYAAASTISGTFNFKYQGSNCPGSNQCIGTCGGGNACASFTRNFTIGGEPISVTGSGRGDLNADGDLNIDFSMMDPPFNMCSLTQVDFTGTGNDAKVNSPTHADTDTSPVNQGVDLDITIVCT